MPEQQHSSVSRGEIVWVRVSFPHKWWPALVLCADDLGVLVSFFDHQNLSPRYFIESEVISFENSFRSLLSHHKNVDNTQTFYGLLDSALKLLGRRVVSSLKCPCQMPGRDESDGGYKRGGVFDGYNAFQPLGLLGFVRQVAVLPWVDAPDFVDAIRAVAQVQAFRGYCSVKQKLVYKESRMRGNNLKLHPHMHSPLDKNMQSISEEPGDLPPKKECLIQYIKLEKDLVFHAIERLNSRIPILKGNPEAFYEKELLITPQTLAKQMKAECLKEITFHLPSLGLDTCYMLGTYTQSVNQSLLRFQNISDQDFSFPGNSETQLSGYAIRRKGNSEELCLSLPDMGSTIYLTRKRRLDQPAAYDYSFKLRRIVSCSSISEAYSSPRSKEDISDVFTLLSILASCFTNSGNHTQFFQDILSQSSVKLTTKDLCSNRGSSVIYTRGNRRMNLFDNESSCMSLSKDASCSVSFPEIDSAQQAKRNTDITRDTKLFYLKMLERGESIKQVNQSCMFFSETMMNLIDGVPKEDPERSHCLTQSFTREPLFDSMPLTHSDNYEDDAGAANKGSLGSSGSTDDQIRSQIISNGETTTKIKRPAGKKNKYLSPSSSTSYSMFNSEAVQQTKPYTPSLHVKFPKNFNLPSKEELMKKFSVFGAIDSLKARIFNWRSSCGVPPGS
ncbi:hypothetical protein L6164_017745 [Bauhinia variegata]|uniref:Uncharacterized protein n=1 Tax=Bauhinia variegata TaxID=167791 RepID=A0ACB9NDT7_BAUVA|nr:hypothetical protein L6164_017745 [Bauhinia variegata]